MHEYHGFSLALIDIVQLYTIADVIVRCEGPGTFPYLVFDLDHGTLRRWGTLTPRYNPLPGGEGEEASDGCV